MIQTIHATADQSAYDPQAGHIHIDRIAVYGPLEHEPVGETFYKCLPDGTPVPAGAQAYTPRRRKHPLPDDIFIKSGDVQDNLRAYRFSFNCCPPQVLQGHNVFGHADLLDYVYTTFDRQTTKHGLPVSEEERALWRTGRQIRLTGIHLTGNFWTPPSAKLDIIAAIDENNPSGKRREPDTCLTLGETPKGRSEHHMLTLYDKYGLLAPLWDKPGPLQGQLLDVARRSLRVEIKLFDYWLRTYGVDPTGRIVNVLELAKKVRTGKAPSGAANDVRSLSFVDSWSRVDVDALFFRLLSSYQIRNSIQRLLTEDELCALTKAERRIYVLWLKRENLLDHFARSTIFEHAKGIAAKTGIDIRGHSRPEKLPAFHLSDVFAPPNLAPIPQELLHDRRRYHAPGQTATETTSARRMNKEPAVVPLAAISAPAIAGADVPY